MVGDKHTDKPFYERVPAVNLEDQIHIVKDLEGVEENVAIEKILAAELDKPFTTGIPPWRLVVLPLGPSRCFVTFAYSHTIGDGPTGVSFHKSLAKAFGNLKELTSTPSSVVQSPGMPLPTPFDTTERLPISWTFLLAPILSLVIPRFISKLLGLRVGASTIDEGTWTATDIFFDPELFESKVKLYEIDASLLTNAVQVSRKHNAKLTGLLQQFIARGLSKQITDPNVTNFVSQTAINMRNSVGVPADEMGEFASGSYATHPRSKVQGPMTEQDWEVARTATRTFAESAVQLQDQPIGLLRYVPSIRKWTMGKIGQRRDCSIEISNIGVFDSASGEGFARITKTVFAQPGHVTGPPISFNFTSVKGGNLVYTVTWQTGALGVGLDEEEKFVDDLCASFKKDFEDLQE